MIINSFLFGGGGGGGDPYWAQTVLLLNFGGADGSTTFIDAKGHAVTANGNAQIDTSLGYNAGLFDGTGDFLSLASSADFGFGTGELTAEFWVRQPSGQQSGDRVLSVGGNAGDLSVGLQAGKMFAGPRNVAYGPIASTAISADTLTHVAACKHSSTMYIYHGGVNLASAADSYDYGAAAAMTIAATVTAASALNGWIAAVRLTKAARYPSGSSFTPEAAPWPTS